MLQHVTLELRRDDWPAAKRFWSIVGLSRSTRPARSASAPLGSRHWGAVSCFVRSPGAHRVELMAAPPTDG